MEPEDFAQLYVNLTQVKENCDGRVIFYFKDNVRDITDQFKEYKKYAVQEDGTGGHRTIQIEGYCYVTIDNIYFLVVHEKYPEDNRNCYPVTIGQGQPLRSAYQNAKGNTVMTPSYEEYMTGHADYKLPEVRDDENGRAMLFYKDGSMDLSDLLIPFEEKYVYKSNSGITSTYLSYCMTEFNGGYFRVLKLHENDNGYEYDTYSWQFTDDEEEFDSIPFFVEYGKEDAYQRLYLYEPVQTDLP